MRFIWCLIVLVIAFSGFVIYGIGYNRDFNLDYELSRASYADEFRLYEEAITMDSIPAADRDLSGYPPAILWVLQLAHNLTGPSESIHPIESIHLARLWVAGVNALTLILLALIGRHLHSPLVGIIAMLGWLLAPLVIDRLHFALTEPFQAFFITLALYAALRTISEQNSYWAILSIIAALVAILFKYSNFPALGFGTGAAIYCLWNQGKSKWPLWLAILAIQAILIIACAACLFLAYDTAYLMDNPELVQFTESGTNSLQIQNFFQVFTEAFNQIGWSLPIFLPVYLLGMALFIKEKSNALRYLWLIMSFFTFFHYLLIPFYIVYWIGVQRYTSPASPILVLLLSTALILIAEWPISLLKKQVPYLRFLLVFSVLSLWLIPQAYKTYESLQIWGMPQQNISFNRWLRDALPEGTIILPYGWHWSLGQWWGFADNRHPWVSEVLNTRSLEEWQSLYVSYAVLHDSHRDGLLRTEAGTALIDELLLLKHYPAEHFGTNEVSFGVYYLGNMDVETNLVFDNQIRLYGYNISPQNPEVGTNLQIQTFWQAISLPKEDYQIFLHLVPENSLSPLTQVDSLPSLDSYPPSQWADFEEVIVGKTLQLALPSDLESGTYRVLLGLYSPNSSLRLSTNEGIDTIELLEITIP